MFTIYIDNVLLLNMCSYTLYNNVIYNNNNVNDNIENVTYLWQRSFYIITISLSCYIPKLTSVFYVPYSSCIKVKDIFFILFWSFVVIYGYASWP